jgi:pantothenate kinase-related protein Tda10
MSERSELKRMGAKAHKNSGRGQYQKADGNLDRFIVDVKEYSKSISINEDIWAKIVTDCLKTDNTKNPLLMLVLGSSGRKTRLAVIEWEILEELLEEING